MSKKTTQDQDLKKLKAFVEESLDNDKAEDIVSIELPKSSALADYMVIASGRSTTQVSAIANHLVTNLKQAGVGSIRVEGMNQADWVIIDTGDIIIHVFRPEVREFYNLERIWTGDGHSEQMGSMNA